ncbi:MAG TPA: sensor domain-containing diguanylate cyclase [Gaiellaceae bacterium]|nr:sensor domain-containing diguanylate cyclase [Gaiellaceae bacterium]
MHSVSIGLAVALGVCAVVALELWRRLRRRTSRDVEAQVAATVGTLEARLEELAQELSSAVGRAEEEAQRNRFLAQVATTIDLDDAIGSTLQAAAALPKIDAAVVELDPDGEGDERLLAAIGLEREADEESGVRIFNDPPEPREARAVEHSYRYADEEGAGALHEALGVPLVARDGRIGWLGVFSRDPAVRFGDEDVRRVEELAERVAPAIENARRFREARQLADLDSLTGLHNRRYFHETLAREVDRAQRYQRRLSLVIVDVDGFKEINDRIGHLAGDAVLAEIAERIRQVVRSADIPCRVGGDEFAVIVPEVEVGQARQLVGRIQRAVSAQPIARAGRVRVSAGVSDLQPNDSPTSLFERGDESLYAAKHASKGGLAAAD